jgi:cob(I)alamin adenosyltransferase
MKIYTKKGDAGETGLFGGSRVPKDDLRIRVYGSLDELNAVLGVCLTGKDVPEKLRERLVRTQAELFQLGAELATPRGKALPIAALDDPETETMEREIDAMEKELPPLKTFILPGGTKVSAELHLARTVSRRAERELVTLNRAEPQRPAVLRYVNRLSDYLFVCARYANLKAGTQDLPWNPPSSDSKKKKPKG